MLLWTVPLDIFCFCVGPQPEGAVMTRWARANNVHKHKPAEATPWSQLRARGRGQPSSSGDHLRGTQPGGFTVKRPNRKKKDYDNEDVNGFMEFLQQKGQPLPGADNGGKGLGQDFREEVEIALKERQEKRGQKDKETDRQKEQHGEWFQTIYCRCQIFGLSQQPHLW